MDSSASPLTRTDVEQLLSQLASGTQLDLRARDLQEIDLSYMDVQGANLQGANLRGAHLRGTNLRETQLQGADLSGADLDGADLSRARMGETEATRARLARARLSYAVLRELDLHGFDLSGLNLYHADLRETDLRGASLRGTDLCGADLSTALLSGPELRDAILYHGTFATTRDRGRSRAGIPPQFGLFRQPFQLSPEGDGQPGRQVLSERDAYLFGMTVPFTGFDPTQFHQLFPQGFSFARARQIFESWLAQTGISYTEQELQALWIGFAHRACDLSY